jgi:hypothetical protein
MKTDNKNITLETPGTVRTRRLVYGRESLKRFYLKGDIMEKEKAHISEFDGKLVILMGKLRFMATGILGTIEGDLPLSKAELGGAADMLYSTANELQVLHETLYEPSPTDSDSTGDELEKELNFNLGLAIKQKSKHLPTIQNLLERACEE